MQSLIMMGLYLGCKIACNFEVKSEHQQPGKPPSEAVVDNMIDFVNTCVQTRLYRKQYCD